MIALVRCTDTSYYVALESMLESLINDGLITAYLGPDGWVDVKRKSQTLQAGYPVKLRSRKSGQRPQL